MDEKITQHSTSQNNTVTLDHITSGSRSDLEVLSSQLDKSLKQQDLTFEPSCTKNSVDPTLKERRVDAWSVNKGQLSERDQEVTQPRVLPRSAVSTEETYTYTSNVKLGPLCPRTSSTSHLPSEPLTVANVGKPNIIRLLSSCPQYSIIPGMTSLHQSHFIAWPDNTEILMQKIPRKRVTLHLRSDYTRSLEESITGFAKMLDMTPSCCRSSDIPGFPSLSKCAENMAYFLPTCARTSRVPGLASVEAVTEYENNVSLWKKPLQIKKGFVNNMPYGQQEPSHYAHVDRSMVTLFPTCARKASVPGFPSAELQSRDSLPSKEPFGAQVKGLHIDRHMLMNKNFSPIVSLVPHQTQVPGMPCQFQSNTENNDWHRLRRAVNMKVEKKTQVYNLQCKAENTKMFKDMVNLLSSCPQNTNVFGLPSAPGLIPSMINTILSCPRHSGVFGLPSKKLCLSGCKEWFTFTHLQLKIPFIKREVMILEAGPCFDRNIVESMSALLPSCPQNARVPGFSSAPTQSLLDSSSVVNVLPSCSNESRVPGMPRRNAKTQSDWLIERQHLLCPRETSSVPLHLEDGKVDYFDSDVNINMVSILPTCAQTVCLPGFPSVELPKMTNLLPACSRHSRVYGIQSRVHSESDNAKWNTDKRRLCESPFTNPKQLSLPIYHHEVYSIEMSMVGIMLSMLPPCARQSKIPGIPSKVWETPVEAVFKEAPIMLNSLATLPEHEHIRGLPAKHCANKYDDCFGDFDAVWQHPFNEEQRAVDQDLTKKMSYKEKDIMLGLHPLCPHQPLIPSLPSASQAPSVPSMIQLIQCCPNQSGVIGFPSLLSHSSVEGRTVMMINTKHCSMFHQAGGSHKDVMKTIGSPMFSPADSKQLSDMINIVSSCPKNTSVLGLPSIHKHCSGEQWPVPTMLLVKSGAKKTKEGQSLMSQQLQFGFSGQVDVQQRMTTTSSTGPTETTVNGLPSSHDECQVDKPSPAEHGAEILWDETNPIHLDSDLNEIQSDVSSTLDVQKDGRVFWEPMESEHSAVLEKG